MPWFKVDDQFHSHPKARKAGLFALGLWSVSGSYSMAYKEDGFVPLWFVKSYPRGEKAAADLVTARLWDSHEKDGIEGYLFRDWADYQPTSEEIEADRTAARDRQRARRKRLRDGGSSEKGKPDLKALSVTRDSRRTSRVTPPACHAVSHGTPSRPDPSRPNNYLALAFHHVVTYSTRGVRDVMMTLRAESVIA